MRCGAKVPVVVKAETIRRIIKTVTVPRMARLRRLCNSGDVQPCMTKSGYLFLPVVRLRVEGMWEYAGVCVWLDMCKYVCMCVCGCDFMRVAVSDVCVVGYVYMCAYV